MNENGEKEKSYCSDHALQNILANTLDIVYIVDKNMKICQVSDSFLKRKGLQNTDEVIGRTIAEVIKDDKFVRKHTKDCEAVFQKGKSLIEVLDTKQNADGSMSCFLSSKYALKEGDNIYGIMCISKDVTVQYTAKQNYLNEIRYLLNLEDMTYGAWLFDLTAWHLVESRIPDTEHCIDNFCDTIDDYLKVARAAVDSNDSAVDFFENFSLESLKSIYESGKHRLDFEYKRIMPDGTRCWVHLIVWMLTDPITGHFMSIFSLTDIHKIKTAHSVLVKAAEVDSMTELLNHDATFMHMEKFLIGEGREGMHALFMVDRDNLKIVNDTFGHKAGDEIIIATAEILKNAFRDTDIIGRVGGDEFLVMMKNVGEMRTLHRKAAELLQSLQYIYGAVEGPMDSTCSIGIAVFKGENKNLDKLYAEADTSLYRAKAAGRNTYAIFDVSQEDSMDINSKVEGLIDAVNLKNLLNSIDGGILILHRERGEDISPVFFSDSFLNMMGGLTQKEAVDFYAKQFFKRVHEDDRERCQKEYEEAIERGESLRTAYRLEGKYGEYQWLSVGANIIKNEGGTVDIYAVHTNIEKIMNEESRLASDEQRFRVAFTQTARTLCEVDIEKAALSFYARDGKPYMDEGAIEGLPQVLVDSGYIHPESAEDFCCFYREMEEGKVEGKKIFKCRYASNGKYGWTSISYQLIFDKDGNPQKAIGSIEELPSIGQAQARMDREITLMEIVGGHLLLTMRVNLTEDKIEYMHAAQNSGFDNKNTESYSAYCKSVIEDVPYDEDTMLLQVNMYRECLVEAYASGKYSIAEEYRRLDGGEIRWTRVAVSMLENPVTRQLYAFIYSGDIEARRSVEAVLPVVVERDSTMHIYTQATVEKLINSLMRGSGTTGNMYSLAIIKMVGLQEALANIGIDNLEIEKMYLCRLLSMMLDHDCIVGRYSSDSVLAFCPNSKSDDWMKSRIENILLRIGQLRNNEQAKARVRLVCGIATEKSGIADLNGMIAQAARVCNTYKNTDSDRVYTFEQYVDSFRITEEALQKSSLVIVGDEELKRPLFGEEKVSLQECMAAMLAANNYDMSVEGALSVIGKYYNAQRVYIIGLINDKTVVSGMHEWMAPGRHSTLRHISGLSLEKLPIFKRALAVTKPVLLDGRGRRNIPSDSSDINSPWCFITVPIMVDNKVSGFLCVENPQENRTDVALLYSLIPIIMHEKERFGLKASGIGIVGRDQLTGLPDHSAYETAMQSFNPDAYHAVGVMYIAVKNLREQNRVKGVIYADEMLSFVSQTLSATMKKVQMYRISGSEFVIICTNLSHEAFEGQCMRVQSILQRRYPKQLCFGEVWAPRGVSARKLLKEAQSFAHSAGVPPRSWDEKIKTKNEQLEELREGINNNNFYVCLQPQIDMRTGKISGAEVLSRYRNEDGNPVLPSEFIPILEKAGAIRELDFFALDKAFSILQDWILKGIRPIPLSVNFSRQTLLSPTVLASTLAIRSRYDVPDDLVEIEITESIGGFESNELQRVVAQIQDQGFKFALDDLGSEYSSLKTLGDFKFDTVKIDKSLIGNFLYNTMSHSVVESILSLCMKNGVKCVAEGVETEAHAEGLIDIGCCYAQGYFYGKPMRIDEFARRFLNENKIVQSAIE